MKLTDQQLESIAPAIVFLEGTGMEGWEFMQDHDPNLPDLSINHHEDVTSLSSPAQMMALWVKSIWLNLTMINSG